MFDWCPSITILFAWKRKQSTVFLVCCNCMIGIHFSNFLHLLYIYSNKYCSMFLLKTSGVVPSPSSISAFNSLELAGSLFSGVYYGVQHQVPTSPMQVLAGESCGTNLSSVLVSFGSQKIMTSEAILVREMLKFLVKNCLKSFVNNYLLLGDFTAESKAFVTHGLQISCGEQGCPSYPLLYSVLLSLVLHCYSHHYKGRDAMEAILK